jgi:hypothetical protein
MLTTFGRGCPIGSTSRPRSQPHDFHERAIHPNARRGRGNGFWNTRSRQQWPSAGLCVAHGRYLMGLVFFSYERFRERLQNIIGGLSVETVSAT